MEKCVYLLDEILSLNGSDVKAIMDSGLNAQELIFSDGDYLQECLKLDKSLVSRLSSLKHLIAEISLQELRNKVVIKGTKDVVKYRGDVTHVIGGTFRGFILEQGECCYRLC